MTFCMVSPWESLGDHSKSCTVNTGYADALWIKPRTLVTLLTNVAETLKSKSRNFQLSIFVQSIKEEACRKKYLELLTGLQRS